MRFKAGLLTFILLAVILATLLGIGIVVGSNLILAVVGFVMLVVAFLARPTTFLYVYVFLIPLYPKLPLVSIKGYWVPIRLEDFFILLLLVIVLLRRAIYPSPRLPMHFLKWILLFVFLCLISTSWGVSGLGSVDARTGLLFFLRLVEYFSVLLISVSEVRSFVQLRNVIRALAVATLAVNVYAILQELGMVPVFNAMHMGREIVTRTYMTEGFGIDRLFSTFGGPYDLAGFYLIVVPCFLLFALDRQSSSFARICYLVLFAYSLFCLYLTFARGPALGVGVSLAVALWLRGWRKFALLMPPLALLPAFLFTGFAARLQELQLLGTFEASLGGRVQVTWPMAWRAFSQSPIVGSGLGSLSPEGIGVDGFYLLLVGMLGVLGTSAFLFLIYRVLTFLYGLYRTAAHSWVQWFAAGIFAGTMGLLVNGVFTDIFFSSKIAEIYWFIVGSLFAADSLTRAELNKRAQTKPGALGG